MPDLTPGKIAELVEFGEAEATANACLCAPDDFAKKFRLEVKRTGSVWVTTLPDVAMTLFNRILGLGIGETATETRLDEAIALLQRAGSKNYMAQVSPLAEPARLSEWLSARGFTKGRNWAKVYRGNEPAPNVATDLRIESIGIEYTNAFTQVVLAAFEMSSELGPLVSGSIGRPGWQHYLAFDGQQPVAAAAMFVSRHVGWLGFGSTLESHRKHGGQGALFARRIRDGIAQGCRWFVTETGEDSPSYHNMLRAGFKLAYLRPNYVYQTPVNQQP